MLIREKCNRSVIPGEITRPFDQKHPIVAISVHGYRTFDIVIRSSGARCYPLKPIKVNK